MEIKPKCLCGHSYKDHCKGGVFHAYYKDAMRQAPRPRGDTCKTQHCESVLCSCTQYRPEAINGN